jgi:putative phosphoribosyl transferase
MLRREADEVRVLLTPEPFYAVGQWYDSFPQVSDEEVVRLLSARAAQGSRTDPAA